MSDIIRKRGDTRRIQKTVRENGVAIDISGWTFTLTINREEDPSDASEEVAQLIGVIVVAGDGTVKFTPTLTDVDWVGTYFYDIEAIDADGGVSTLDKGRWVNTQDITKSDEEFIWTPSLTPNDGDPVVVDATEFWRLTTFNAGDALTYETRDTRRVIRWDMDVNENAWAGRDIMALGPESPRPSNLWYPVGWEFKATAYVAESRVGLLLVTLGYSDYVDNVVNNIGGMSAGWGAFVEGASEDNNGPTDDASWVNPDWYVFGLRVDADGVVWGILHPETEVGDYGTRDWMKIMPDGWTWNPAVPFSVQFGGRPDDPADPAWVIDLWKYEWRRLS